MQFGPDEHFSTRALPVEIELPTLHLSATTNLNPSQEAYAHEQIIAMECLDEYCQDVNKGLQQYREQMEHYCNWSISPRSFTVGILVLHNIKEAHTDLSRSKFAPSWERPYAIMPTWAKDVTTSSPYIETTLSLLMPNISNFGVTKSLAVIPSCEQGS